MFKKLILVFVLLASSLFAQKVNTMACEDWVDSVYASKAWVNASFVKADYVFSDDYELLPISEHSEAMWSDGKLPGVKANGTLGILEELEVAHIYIAELEERLKKLEVLITNYELGINNCNRE